MNLDLDAISKLWPDSSPLSQNKAWTSIIGPVLLALAHESLIENICNYILEPSAATEAPTLDCLRSLREALLKSSPLVGFPRAINGLTILNSTLKQSRPSLQAQLAADKSLRSDVPLSERQARGKAFFGRIYDRHTERVLANLNEASGGELGEFAINCVYGDLVAEDGRLGAKDTGLVEFAVCLAMGVPAQAKGHMYGARNLGNGKGEIEAVVEMVRIVARDLNMVLDEEKINFVKKLDEDGW
ncbi:MAG: hypothetical protein M1828_005400 [Chrysothrix sp. TS-e1954]|nr:MAG: hypothetical protein M1828_005400 [Chrysothrix sp. TS-e1954]